MKRFENIDAPPNILPPINVSGISERSVGLDELVALPEGYYWRVSRYDPNIGSSGFDWYSVSLFKTRRFGSARRLGTQTGIVPIKPSDVSFLLREIPKETRDKMRSEPKRPIDRFTGEYR